MHAGETHHGLSQLFWTSGLRDVVFCNYALLDLLLYKIVMDEMLWSFNLTNTYLTIVLTHVFFSFLLCLFLSYANCRYVIYFHVWIKFYEMNVFLESLVDPADCNLCHAFTSL